MDCVKWKTSAAVVTDEIHALLALMADDRDRYMPEILAQADGAALYWLQLLNLGGGEKPGTHAVIAYAQRVGEMVALHYKNKFTRVRPSALCPGLLVPFGPPRHPAFPSGHALTGHLTSALLRKIQALEDYKGNELDWLARRVAMNRERAGLHYASDSAAGKLLAEAVAAQLTTPPSGGGSYFNPLFFNGADGILDKAKTEWVNSPV